LTGVKVIGKARGQEADARVVVEIIAISGVTVMGRSFYATAKGGDGAMGYVIGRDARAGIPGVLKDAPPGYFAKYAGLGGLQAFAAGLAESTTETSTDATGRQFSNVISGKQAENAAYVGLSGAIGKTAELWSEKLESWEKMVVTQPRQDVVIMTLQPVTIEEIDVEQFSMLSQRHHTGLYLNR
jgi:hypothetical protein